MGYYITASRNDHLATIDGIAKLTGRARAGLELAYDLALHDAAQYLEHTEGVPVYLTIRATHGDQDAGWIRNVDIDAARAALRKIVGSIEVTIEAGGWTVTTPDGATQIYRP